MALYSVDKQLLWGVFGNDECIVYMYSVFCSYIWVSYCYMNIIIYIAELWREQKSNQHEIGEVKKQQKGQF